MYPLCFLLMSIILNVSSLMSVKSASVVKEVAEDAFLGSISVLGALFWGC